MLLFDPHKCEAFIQKVLPEKSNLESLTRGSHSHLDFYRLGPHAKPSPVGHRGYPWLPGLDFLG